MTIRTTSETITFHRPFWLKGVDRSLPPADYRVVTDRGSRGSFLHGLSPDIDCDLCAGGGWVRRRDDDD